MKVCFLLNGFSDNGGIGRVTAILANQLAGFQNYGVHTISFFDENKQDLFRIDGDVEKSYLYRRQISMTRAMLKCGSIKLRRYLVDNGIDVLVACGALYFPISTLACVGTKTRCVCWEHSNTSTTDDHSFQRSCRAFGARYADMIVVLTKRDEDNYARQYRTANIKQIYNPVDPLLFEQRGIYNPKSKKIISVGRLAPPKNYDTLIDIANVILLKHEDWCWDIYGDGELMQMLNNKIKGMNIQNRLSLKGQSNKLYMLYKEYAFMVMTSIREGFPMALLEAAANSLPLVSFDIETGPNEIIKHGQNGFLIEAFDIDKMTEAIEKLIQWDKLRWEMSQNSDEICKQFKLEHIIEQWIKLFESLFMTVSVEK